MRIISRQQIDEFNEASPGNCWLTWRGAVYDVSTFAEKHPGGSKILRDFAGEDVTLLMNATESHQHSKYAYKMMADMKVGILDGGKPSHDERSEFDVVAEADSKLDYTKSMVMQVAKLGNEYTAWMNQPIDKDLVLFPWPFIEKYFSTSPWWAVPLAWLPLTAFLILSSFQQLQHDNPTFKLPLLFIAGYLIWQLMEYTLHRFLFHFEPKNRSNKFHIVAHFLIHGQHHKNPFNRGRLVFPPVIAAPLVVLFYNLYKIIIPELYLHGIMAGAIFGYVAYECTHYYLHHGQPRPGSFFDRMRQWHLRHHYIDHDKGFGISNNFLDHIIGTDFAMLHQHKKAK